MTPMIAGMLFAAVPMALGVAVLAVPIARLYKAPARR